MIYITEDSPEKLVGISSLFIFMEDYNLEISQYIKSLGTYQYNEKTKEIEVPTNQLAKLLDYLVYFDDVVFDALDYKDNDNNVKKMVLKHKTEPLRHQIEGIEYGLNHPKFLLLDAPGLGKTMQATYLAEELKSQEGIEHCLVICCVASLRTNWSREIDKHSLEDCLLLGARFTRTGSLVWDGIPKRIEQLKQPIKEFFIIMNIELLRSEGILDAIKHGPNKIGMIIVDEIHKVSGWQSIQGNNLLELDAPHKVAMTGTLITKNPLSTYLPLVWIGKERKRTVTKFKNTYCELDPNVLGRILSYKNLDILKNELSTCSLRRTIDVLAEDGGKKLPPIKFIDEYLDMDKTQRDFYDAFEKLADGDEKNKSELKKYLKKEADLIKLKTRDQRAFIIRMIQASTCPSMLTTKEIPSIKIDRALDLIEEIVENDKKVVVFSSFKEPLYNLQKRLKKEKELESIIATGDQGDQKIGEYINDFQSANSKCKIFLATTQKMGTGFTLTEASYVIFLDLPWNEVDYSQAWGRVHRIGCKHPVFVYNLFCEGTIDMAISRVVYKKGALAKYIVDDVKDSVVMKALGRVVKDI